MEVMYNPDTWGWDKTIVKNAAIQMFVDTCEEQRKNYLRQTEREYVEADVQEDYNERIKLGVGMLEYYANNVAPLYDKNLKPLKVEVEFIVPIQGPKGEYIWCKCKRCEKTMNEYLETLEGNMSVYGGWIVEPDYSNGAGYPDASPLEEWKGLPVCLAGRIDMLAEDSNGDLWIVDWKTAARLSRGDVSGQDRDEFLELDDQIGSYVMALRRKLGLNVRGFVYVELKKAYPEPPTMNKSRRLGKLFSVNKQQATDYDMFLSTVRAKDTQAFEEGLYDEHLAWLKDSGERFHGRYQVYKTEAELHEIENNLYWEAFEMCSPNTIIYPSAGRFNCAQCAFRQPCLEKNRQGDYQYILDTMFEKRKKHYWDKEASTDGKGGQ
jgi:hypothetical protein